MYPSTPLKYGKLIKIQTLYFSYGYNYEGQRDLQAPVIRLNLNKMEKEGAKK